MRTIPTAPMYAATECGEIVNTRTGLVLKPQGDGRAGYLKVCIKHADGAMRSRYVHHLVAEAFIGFRPDGADIDHKDGNRANNRADNLRYCTRRENQRNPNNNGMNAWQSFAARRVVATKDGVSRSFANASEAARTLGLCLSGVSCALAGRPVNKGYRNGKPRFCEIRTCGGYSFSWEKSA